MSSILRYSLEALACGEYPVGRHDDLPLTFGEGDEHRFGVLGGQPLGFKGALIGLKSDWDAVSTYLGLPTATTVSSGHICKP